MRSRSPLSTPVRKQNNGALTVRAIFQVATRLSVGSAAAAGKKRASSQFQQKTEPLMMM